MTHRITCLCYMIVIQHCVSEFKKWLSNIKKDHLCFIIHLRIFNNKKSTWTMEYSSYAPILFFEPVHWFLISRYGKKQNSEVDSVLLMLQVQRTTLTENDWTVQIQSLNEKRMPCKLLEQLTLKVQKSF